MRRADPERELRPAASLRSRRRAMCSTADAGTRLAASSGLALAVALAAATPGCTEHVTDLSPPAGDPAGAGAASGANVGGAGRGGGVMGSGGRGGREPGNTASADGSGGAPASGGAGQGAATATVSAGGSGGAPASGGAGQGAASGTGGADGSGGAPGAGGSGPTTPGGHLWSKRYGDVNDDWVGSLAVNAAGNVVLAWYGTYPTTDMRLEKLDAGGIELWSKSFSADAIVAADPQGDVVLVGVADPMWEDFGGGPLAVPPDPALLVVRLDEDGNFLWLHPFFVGESTLSGAKAVAVDGTGSVLVTGTVDGTIDFGGGPLTSTEYEDIFVAKLDKQGNHLWSKLYGNASGIQWSGNVVAEASGDVFVAGGYVGTLDFGGQTLTNPETASHVFVVKLDEAGDPLWSRDLGASTVASYMPFGWSWSIAPDGSGGLLVAGSLGDPVDMGGGPLTTVGLDDVVVARFDANGNHLWSKSFGSPTWDEGVGVAGDAAGNAVVTGYCSGSIDFGGGPLPGAGSFDVFVAKLDANGEHVWSERFGDDYDQRGERLAVDGAGNVLVAGKFNGTVDFGGGPLGVTWNDDVFVAKLAP